MPCSWFDLRGVRTIRYYVASNLCSQASTMSSHSERHETNYLQTISCSMRSRSGGYTKPKKTVYVCRLSTYPAHRHFDSPIALCVSSRTRSERGVTPPRTTTRIEIYTRPKAHAGVSTCLPAWSTSYNGCVSLPKSPIRRDLALDRDDVVGHPWVQHCASHKVLTDKMISIRGEAQPTTRATTLEQQVNLRRASEYQARERPDM